MKFRVKDLEKYLSGRLDWGKISNELTMKSFETSYQNGVLEVDILPNRYADAASLIGLAKEISLISGLKLKEPKINLKNYEINKKAKIKVINQTKYCSYYFGRVILNVQNKPSPQWLKEFVEFYGFNSINFLVDLANFVMIEYGAPLHIFDLDKVKGNIYVRLARKGERFISLENKEYLFSGEEIVIADQEKILGLAGIKGGKSAEVTLETKNIFIEAAIFSPEKIYATSRKLNLRTDASFRFERKVAPIRSLKALARVSLLIKENLGGEILKESIGEKKLQPKKINFNLAKVEKFTGLKIKKEEIIKILRKIFTQISYQGQRIVLLVPLDRLDLQTEEDIVEEIIRIYDLNKIKPLYEPSFREVFVDEILEFNNYLRRILTSLAYHEVYNYSFFGDKEKELINNNIEKIEVLNPVSENYKYFQSTLTFNLLKSVYLNQFQFREIKIFGISKVAWLEKNAIEKYHLGIVYAFEDKKEILKELRGVLTCLENEFNLSFELKEFEDNLFDLGAQIYVYNQNLGIIGVVRQKILTDFDLDLSLGIIELDIEKLKQFANLKHLFKPWPAFPQIIRDLSFFVDEKVKFSELKKEIEKLKINYLQEVSLIDIYFKEEKSMTLRFIFGHPERSLTDQEVNSEMNKIENYLKEKFKATIR